MAWWVMSAMAWTPFPTEAPPDGQAKLEAFLHARGDGSCGNGMRWPIPRVPPALAEKVIGDALAAGLYDAEFSDTVTLVERYELTGLAEPLRARYLAGARPDVAVELLTALSIVGPDAMQPWVDAEVALQTQAMLTALDGGTVIPGEFFPLWIARRDVAGVEVVQARAAQVALQDSAHGRRASDYARMYLPQVRVIAEQLAALDALTPEARVPAALAAYATRQTDDRARPALARMLREAGRDPALRTLAADAARAQLAKADAPYERLKLLDALETFGGPLDPASRALRTASEAAIGHLIVYELSLRSAP